MSTHIHVDSRWREREVHPNPAEFTIRNEIVEKWRTSNRSVQAVRPHNKRQVTNLTHTVELRHLTLPYDFGGATASGAIEELDFVYVSFQPASMYGDTRLLNTMEEGRIVNQTIDLSGNLVTTSLKDATFVARCDKVQESSGGVKRWVHYVCDMNVTMRFDPQREINFRVFSSDGKTLPIVDNDTDSNINRYRQVNAVFEITPYIREGEYDNHMVTLYNRDA